MATDGTGKGLLVKADLIANAFRDEVKRALGDRTQRPKLVGILSTSAAPSKFYADFTRKQCEELGVEFLLKKTGAALSTDLAEGEGVEEAIIESNEDDSVDGIMVRNLYVGELQGVLNIYPGLLPYLWLSAGPWQARAVELLTVPAHLYFQDHYLQQVRGNPCAMNEQTRAVLLTMPM